MSTSRSVLGVALLAVLVQVGCTKDNPRACGDADPCTDPAAPYCDLDGLVAGVPGECIAVSCTPGEFKACDADQAIQCNAAGTNYDNVVCELGCDPSSNGCRLCNPNETACTNGVTATCDASGAVVASTPCPLGCFESEPRCRDVDPSNDLGQYLDMAATAPAINAIGGLRVDSKNGTIYSTDTQGLLGVPSFLVPAPTGGVPVRVFVVSSATIGNMTFEVFESLNVPPPAVAFVSAGDIVIRGSINAGISYVYQFDFGPQGPGSVTSGSCVGSDGRFERTPNADYVIGAGGGGNGTAGGIGGGVIGPGTLDGAAGGQASGDQTIEPLVGGCAGGGVRNEFTGTQIAAYSGAGGGALQIVSRTMIRLETGSSIMANGAAGYGANEGGFAGGAGGSILLEAPTITLASNAALTANGGSGAGGDRGTNTAGNDGGRTTIRAAAVQPTGGVCAAPALCGASGAGGALEGAPTDGAGIGYDSNNDRYAGGGAGAAGRIRLNTADGTYVMASDSIESPQPSVGTLRTR